MGISLRTSIRGLKRRKLYDPLETVMVHHSRTNVQNFKIISYKVFCSPSEILRYNVINVKYFVKIFMNVRKCQPENKGCSVPDFVSLFLRTSLNWGPWCIKVLHNTRDKGSELVWVRSYQTSEGTLVVVVFNNNTLLDLNCLLD